MERVVELPEGIPCVDSVVLLKPGFQKLISSPFDQ